MALCCILETKCVTCSYIDKFAIVIVCNLLLLFWVPCSILYQLKLQTFANVCKYLQVAFGAG